jgi:phosphohistidine phosphatase
MLLYIVRHAHAGEPDSEDYPDDNLRPLTDKGRKRFRKLVRRLVAEGLDPLRIATSPLLRCQQTAEILSAESPRNPDLTILDELSPGAELAPLLAWTQHHADEDVAWVGHAPDVAQWTEELLGAETGSIEFTKGAIAAIRMDVQTSPRGQLLWFVNPKLIE